MNSLKTFIVTLLIWAGISSGAYAASYRFRNDTATALSISFPSTVSVPAFSTVAFVATGSQTLTVSDVPPVGTPTVLFSGSFIVADGEYLWHSDATVTFSATLTDHAAAILLGCLTCGFVFGWFLLSPIEKS